MKFNISTNIRVGVTSTQFEVVKLRGLVKGHPGIHQVVVHRYPAAPGLRPTVDIWGEMVSAEFRDLLTDLDRAGWLE